MTDKKTIWFIFCMALVIRLFLVIVFPLDAPDTPRYDALATNILNKHSYTVDGETLDVETPPLYPVFLAGIYAVFGHNFSCVRLIQVLISAITVVAVWWIAWKVFKNKIVANLTGILACFHPELAVPCAYILTETLATFLIVVTMGLIILAVRKESKLVFFLSGIILGLSTLCRPATLIFPVFFTVCAVVFGRRWKQVLLGGVILLVGMVMVISPWTLRNYITFNEFIPVGVGSGANLWIGSYQPWDGDYNYKDRTDQFQILKGRSQIEADRKFKEEAIKNIKADFGRYLRLCLKKFFRFWFLVPGSKEVLREKENLKILLYVFHYILLFFFVVGTAFVFFEKNKERKQDALILQSVILYFTLIHTALFAIPRYRIPIIPLFITFVAVGMEHIYRVYISENNKLFKPLDKQI